MPLFQYQAVDTVGGRKRGEVNAANEEEAILRLSHDGLLVAKISLSRQSEPSLTVLSSKKLGLAELDRFTTELSLLLRNGVRIDRGLTVLLGNAVSAAERRFLQELLDKVRGGEALSTALRAQGALFSETYLNLVVAGEASGRLSDVFEQLAADLKYRRKLQNQIIQALTYPLVILFVCVASIVFVFNYIVPQMAPLFSNAVELPGYTKLLLSSSQWIRDYQLYVALSFPLLILTGTRLMSSRQRRDEILASLMRWPVIGGLILAVNQVQANSTLSITLASGLSVDRAFGLAAHSVQNKELKQSLIVAQERVRRGDSISAVLRGNPLYPDFSHSLIEVGEESGDLEPCFTELADRARSNFELKINQMTAILEPVLILFMGGVVGGVVVTMLLSVVSVNDIAL